MMELIFIIISMFFAGIEDNFWFSFNSFFVLVPIIAMFFSHWIIASLSLLFFILDENKFIGTGDICFFILLIPFIKSFFLFFSLFFPFCLLNYSFNKEKIAGVFPMLVSFLFVFFS